MIRRCMICHTGRLLDKPKINWSYACRCGCPLSSREHLLQHIFSAKYCPYHISIYLKPADIIICPCPEVHDTAPSYIDHLTTCRASPKYTCTIFEAYFNVRLDLINPTRKHFPSPGRFHTVVEPLTTSE